ncbi:uncharacterized protein V1518DRAFT_427871 [Limtongia smithiae]|uniref:uncharacterized protein n=1 Tax=Limtongia smithiae TaxID=1125753 RepID=UPI0034CDDE09
MSPRPAASAILEFYVVGDYLIRIPEARYDECIRRSPARLCYYDEDGDRITVGSSTELRERIRELNAVKQAPIFSLDAYPVLEWFGVKDTDDFDDVSSQMRTSAGRSELALSVPRSPASVASYSDDSSGVLSLDGRSTVSNMRTQASEKEFSEHLVAAFEDMLSEVETLSRSATPSTVTGDISCLTPTLRIESDGELSEAAPEHLYLDSRSESGYSDASQKTVRPAPAAQLTAPATDQSDLSSSNVWAETIAENVKRAIRHLQEIADSDPNMIFRKRVLSMDPNLAESVAELIRKIVNQLCGTMASAESTAAGITLDRTLNTFQGFAAQMAQVAAIGSSGAAAVPGAEAGIQAAREAMQGAFQCAQMATAQLQQCLREIVTEFVDFKTRFEQSKFQACNPGIAAGRVNRTLSVSSFGNSVLTDDASECVSEIGSFDYSASPFAQKVPAVHPLLSGSRFSSTVMNVPIRTPSVSSAGTYEVFMPAQPLTPPQRSSFVPPSYGHNTGVSYQNPHPFVATSEIYSHYGDRDSYYSSAISRAPVTPVFSPVRASAPPVPPLPVMPNCASMLSQLPATFGRIAPTFPTGAAPNVYVGPSFNMSIMTASSSPASVSQVNVAGRSSSPPSTSPPSSAPSAPSYVPDQSAGGSGVNSASSSGPDNYTVFNPFSVPSAPPATLSVPSAPADNFESEWGEVANSLHGSKVDVAEVEQAVKDLRVEEETSEAGSARYEDTHNIADQVVPTETSISTAEAATTTRMTASPWYENISDDRFGRVSTPDRVSGHHQRNLIEIESVEPSQDPLAPTLSRGPSFTVAPGMPPSPQAILASGSLDNAIPVMRSVNSPVPSYRTIDPNQNHRLFMNRDPAVVSQNIQRARQSTAAAATDRARAPTRRHTAIEMRQLSPDAQDRADINRIGLENEATEEERLVARQLVELELIDGENMTMAIYYAQQAKGDIVTAIDLLEADLKQQRSFERRNRSYADSADPLGPDNGD